MAWRIEKVEKQREDFINEYLENKVTVTELCNRFEISRKTAYKWILRYEGSGLEGLKDQSKARHSQIHKTSDEVIEKILTLKYCWEEWGPKKIVAYLDDNYPFENWPAASTIGKILEEHGLTISRKLRKRFPVKTNPLSHCKQANDVWCIDFKGWFKTKDNVKCDPITITDAYSRYIILCKKLCKNDTSNVWDILVDAFHKYGLPIYIRHDNGPPFATCGAGRLSSLSIKLIKAGIIPEWIDPGKPYQNGRHERMHLTLKQNVYPKKFTLKEQQIKFMEFQNYFNFDRPHEALNQRTPASLYVPSQRIWQGHLKSPEYSSDYKTKRVRESGQISWSGKEVFIGKALRNEYVGLKERKWRLGCNIWANISRIDWGRWFAYPTSNENKKNLLQRENSLKKKLPILPPWGKDYCWLHFSQNY